MNFRLKKAIIERFGSQADFAMKIKEHEAVISRAVRGRYDPPAEKRAQWAEILGCDEKELFAADAE